MTKKKKTTTTKGKDALTAVRGRDGKTGAFVPIKEAVRSPGTTTTERMPKGGDSRPMQLEPPKPFPRPKGTTKPGTKT
jgi:hypothetical protein